MTHGEAEPYRLVYSDAVKKKIEELTHQLLKAGATKGDLRRALLSYEAALRSQPLETGEPYRNLHHSELILCVCFRPPFGVDYAVQEELRLVFIRNVFHVRGHAP